MNAILHTAQTLASFALVLGVLVSIHELGHYFAAARWCGIGVEAFSLGLRAGARNPGPIGQRHGVEDLRMLPLGGYVKMHGMSRDRSGGRGRHRPELVPAPSEAYCRKVMLGQTIAFVAALLGRLANFRADDRAVHRACSWPIGRQVPLPVVGDVVRKAAPPSQGRAACVGDRIVGRGWPRRSTNFDLPAAHHRRRARVVRLSRSPWHRGTGRSRGAGDLCMSSS